MNLYLFNIIFGLSHRNFLADDLGVFLAQYLPYLLVLGAAIFVFLFEGWKKRFLVAGEILLSIILSWGIITNAIKFFYHAARPFQALNLAPLIMKQDGGFPSEHAAILFALAMTIFYFSKKLGWWYLAFALVVGLARIFAGVHWPVDILGGAVIGVVSAWLIHELVKPIAAEIEKEKTAGAA